MNIKKISILYLGLTLISSAMMMGILGTQSVRAATMSSGKLWVPMATSGDHLYLTWSGNKTGNWEVMFKASDDAGKTFGQKVNLSKSPGESTDPQVAASGSNVFVSFWDDKSGTREPYLTISADNGKTFGEPMQLSK